MTATPLARLRHGDDVRHRDGGDRFTGLVVAAQDLRGVHEEVGLDLVLRDEGGVEVPVQPGGAADARKRIDEE